jgi:hypothetical protein
MEFFSPKILFNSLVYSILGVIVFWVSFVVVDKFTPYDLWAESDHPIATSGDGDTDSED